MSSSKFLLGLLPLAVALPLFAGCSGSPADDTGDGSESALNEGVDVFAATAALEFKLDAPFSQLISRFRNHQPDPPAVDAGADDADAGPAPAASEDYTEQGTMILAGKTIDVRIGIRGHTSPYDCPFPKYKVEFLDKKQTAGTPFAGHKKFRVNSHCGNGGPYDHGGQFSRVMNEISPIREELAYRTIRAAGVATYLTRLGKISYNDKSAVSPFPAMVRHGILIESGDDAAKRFAKSGVIDKDSIYFNDPTGRPTNVGADCSLMKDDDIAQAYLAEVLLANYDWQFELGRPGQLWNIDVFGVAGKASQLPIPQDFDLATSVQALQDPGQILDMEMQTFRGAFAGKPDVVQRVAARFKANRAAIEREMAAVEKDGVVAKRLPTMDGATTTDLGFVNAHKQLAAFYALPELAGGAASSDGGAPSDAGPWSSDGGASEGGARSSDGGAASDAGADAGAR